jgi:hypothetical protein
LAMGAFDKQLFMQGATSLPGTRALCVALVNAETARCRDIITLYHITSE